MKIKSIFVCALFVGCAIVSSAPQMRARQRPSLRAAQADALRRATQISAYATAQCRGKDSDAAPDCWIKALWKATQCPGEITAEAGESALAPSHPCALTGNGFEYDVASIKPHLDNGKNMGMFGGSDDGFRAVNTTMQSVVLNAYSTGLQIQITGGPGWLKDAHYDIEAKFVPEVGDALRKLSGDDSNFARRYMMQQLLKDRMSLSAHAETKDVPAYDLVVGKNGPKFKEADSNEKNIGRISTRIDQGKWVVEAPGVLMAGLARNLAQFAGRPVFDKTGLTSRYDIKLEFAREQPLSAGAPDGGAAGTGPTPPPDLNGPSVATALEEQLGLKLVPSRGPVQVVVIEHIDRPDAN